MDQVDKIWKDMKDAVNAELAKIQAERESLRKDTIAELAKIQAERDAFNKEKAEFEETKKKIASIHFPSNLKLDVGGKKFKTTLNTLKKEDSMLSRMFSGSGFQVQKDEDGCYFIDRPGKPFGPILHYLQTGDFLPPKDPIMLEAVRKEVDFYQVPGLVEYFKKPKSTFVIESKILTDPMKVNLKKMLDPNLINWRLILDSTVSGQSAKVFDSAVKNKSRILVVIQSTSGFVFGAYIADTFGVPGSWVKGSTDTFLWTLRNNNSPVKLITTGNCNSTGHFTDCGLHLGNQTDELVAFCSHTCTTPSAFNTLAPGYNATVDANLLAGSSNWTPQRMEVFETTN